MKTYMLIFFLFSILSFSNCQSDKEISESKKNINYIHNVDSLINIKKYDSVKYFQDVNWASYKGIHQIDPNKTVFPFTAYCYKKDSLEIQIWFSSGKCVKQTLNVYKNYKYLIRERNDRRDGLIKRVTLFLNDTSSISFFGEMLPDSNGAVKFNAFTLNCMYVMDTYRAVTYSYPYEDKKYDLDDIITLYKKNKEIKDYILFEEVIFKIENNDLYYFSDMTIDKGSDTYNNNNKKGIAKRNIIKGSFFYYYNEIGGF